MGGRLNDLPDDVLCYILSFLTVRDSVRARLVSSRWRYLHDGRRTLHFDAFNVFGNKNCYGTSYQSKLARVVDQLLEIHTSQCLSMLKVQFGLGNSYSSHIDRWIQCTVRRGIKELDLNFFPVPTDADRYVFWSHQLCPPTACHLSCLHLVNCELRLSPSCTSWIKQLTTLHLSRVTLNQNDIEFILSCGLNLISLSLDCCLPKSSRRIRVELLGLKKLVIADYSKVIELCCPNLEMFEYTGRGLNISFSYLPFLRKVCAWRAFQVKGCSLMFADLIRFAPNLEALDLLVTTEVQPLPLAARLNKSSVKQLDILALIHYGFDLFTLTYFLNASPSLEMLRVKLRIRTDTRKSLQRKYVDRQHFKLKEIQIDGFCEQWNEMNFVQYLLKNAVALQRMVIVLSSTRIAKREIFAKLQHVNANVELVIL